MNLLWDECWEMPEEAGVCGVYRWEIERGAGRQALT